MQTWTSALVITLKVCELVSLAASWSLLGITEPAMLKYRNEEELLATVDDSKHYNDEVIFATVKGKRMEFGGDVI